MKVKVQKQSEQGSDSDSKQDKTNKEEAKS